MSTILCINVECLVQTGYPFEPRNSFSTSALECTYFNSFKKMTSTRSNFSSCSLCHVVNNHKNEVQKMIKNAKKNQKEIDRDLFISTEICETPQGVKLTLKEIERIYSDHYPEWNQNLQCFPQGPIFSDKLFTTQPYINAKDIEDRKNHLRSKIKTL